MSSRRSDRPGNDDRNHGEAVIEILAEAPLGDHPLEVLRRRGDDADIDLDALGAADPFELLVDQHAQDLALRVARHVGDLVEIERAAMGFLQRADLAFAAVGFGAEQLDLHALRA